MSKKNNKQQRNPQQSQQYSASTTLGEHERKQATIIGVSVCAAVIAVIIAIVAVVWAVNRPKEVKNTDGTTVSLRQARSDVAAVRNSPKHSHANGGFLFSKDGIDKPVKNAPTVQVYMDFLCPGCGSMDRQLFPTWDKMVQAGQLNLEIHPNSFLDNLSTDGYSTRAASAAAYIADKDPDHALAFVQSMFDESFQPKEGDGYKATPNSAIVAQAKKAGVKADVAEKSVKGTYTKWIKKLAVYTPMRPVLQHPDGANKGEMTTPTLLVNNQYWDYGAATQDGTQLPDAFLHALGIKASAVGQSGTMPSIGSTKGPQPLGA